MTFAVPAFLAATAGLAIFILGATLNLRLAVLRHFNIPDPVSGGLLAALIALVFLLLSGVTLDLICRHVTFFWSCSLLPSG
jgi:ESS family glutamate:Na+ symporter